MSQQHTTGSGGSRTLLLSALLVKGGQRGHKSHRTREAGPGRQTTPWCPGGEGTDVEGRQGHESATHTGLGMQD